MPAAVAACAGVGLSEWFGAAVGVGVLIAAALGGALLFALRRRIFHNAGGLAYGVVLLAFALGAWRHHQVVTLPGNHIARAATIEPMLTRIAGRVVTAPLRTEVELRNPFRPFPLEKVTRFVLDADELRTAPTPLPICGLVRVTVVGDPPLALGDRIVVAGKLGRPRPAANPGETDWRRAWALQGIHAILTVESADLLRVDSAGGPVAWTVNALRSAVRRAVLDPSAEADDDASRLLDCMVLGQRSSVGRQINDAFLRTGVIHFLSVSGAHIALLCGAAYWGFRRLLRLGPRITAVAIIALLLLYLAIAEQNAPIVRATVMGLLACAAVLLRRPLAVLNWLALSAAAFVLWSPMQLFQASFQLSFVQVAALVMVCPQLERWLTRRDPLAEGSDDVHSWHRLAGRIFARGAARILATCVLCWLVAAPLSMLHFGMLAPWGAMHSVLLTPMIALVTIGGFLAIPLSVIPFAQPMIAAALHAAADGLNGAVASLASWPGTLLHTPTPSGWLVLATYAAVLVLLALHASRESLPPKQRAAMRGGAIGAAAIIVGMWCWPLVAPPTLERGSLHLVALAVGDGNAAIVVSPDGRTAACDLGTIANRDVGETAVTAIRALGAARPDWLSLSHEHMDHYSGAPTLLRNYPARLYAYPRFARRVIDRSSPLAVHLPEPVDAAPLRPGDPLGLGAARVETLWPPEDSIDARSENDRSLVHRIAFARRAVLLTGDASHGAIPALVELHHRGAIDLHADVLVAPHHGAVTPSTGAFLQAVAPSIVIISAASRREAFEDLVRRRLGASVRVFTTGVDGCVQASVSADGALHVRTFARRE